jgi:hypothetical protein
LDSPINSNPWRFSVAPMMDWSDSEIVIFKSMNVLLGDKILVAEFVAVKPGLKGRQGATPKAPRCKQHTTAAEDVRFQLHRT